MIHPQKSLEDYPHGIQNRRIDASYRWQMFVSLLYIAQHVAFIAEQKMRNSIDRKRRIDMYYIIHLHTHTHVGPNQSWTVLVFAP